MSFTHPDELHTAFAEALKANDLDALLGLCEDGAIQVRAATWPASG